MPDCQTGAQDLLSARTDFRRGSALTKAPRWEATLARPHTNQPYKNIYIYIYIGYKNRKVYIYTYIQRGFPNQEIPEEFPAGEAYG